MLPSFNSSTRTFQGVPAAVVLRSELERLQAKRILFVTDPGVHGAGLIGSLEAATAEICESSETFGEVVQDPTVRLMDRLGRRATDGCIDALVAVGGGACMDAAKAAALVASHGGSVLDLVGEDKVTRSPLPVICVPTTAGTGSEVSWHISVNDTDRNLKVTIRSPLAVPAVAILDPAMVSTVPRTVAASAGMDTLTHLVESFVGNVGRWDLTDALCLHAIGIVGRSLRPYWDDRSIAEHAMQMQVAACIGGLALSHSRTGIVHQMARPLGARFHVPHGLANAVLLPYCLAFTSSSVPARYAKVARALGVDASLSDESAAARLSSGVHELNAAIEIPRSLRDFGVTEEARDDLAQDALQGKPRVTNPCDASHTDVVKIYRAALRGGRDA